MLALDAPFVAPLLAPHCLADGAEVAIVAGQSPRLETEFLLALGADLPARAEPWRRDEVAAAIDYVAPAFEIVGCRFAGGFKGNGLLAIADFGGNAAMVQGAPVRDWRRFDLAAHAVRLSMNGAETIVGSGSALIFGDPIAALAGSRASRRSRRGACAAANRDDRHLHRPYTPEAWRPRRGRFR